MVQMFLLAQALSGLAPLVWNLLLTALQTGWLWRQQLLQKREYMGGFMLRELSVADTLAFS